MAIVTAEPHDHPSRPIEAGPLHFPPPMSQYLGLHIKRFCSATITTDPAQNHCAHFVCHVMRYDCNIPGAVKCSLRTKEDSPGVYIRVDDVFNIAPDRRDWGPPDGELEQPCLVFVTVTTNVTQPKGQPPILGSHGTKHVGIFTEERIWNYSNTGTRVVADDPIAFRSKFRRAYGPNVVFFRSHLLRP
jgi:hypothetical protein